MSTDSSLEEEPPYKQPSSAGIGAR